MKFLLLFLISFSVFGQASNPNETLKIGKGSTTVDKGLIFDTNEGASNRTLKVDGTTKALKFTGNDVEIGDGNTASNKTLVLDPSTGAGVRWNGTAQRVEKSNDGTNYKDIGAGGSGGSGVNGLQDENPDAESGVTKWTASAGTFIASSSDPLEGDNSFNWTPAAQNDTLQTDLKTYDKSTFRGRACQAEVLYTGGDENLTLKVMNGDDDVLGSLVLQAHSIAGLESVFFLCPNAAEIGADADKGNLKVRLENTGASASALIAFDSVYLGTLKGLVETNLPDHFSAYSGDGAGSITSENVDWVNGNCVDNGVGNFTCNFNSGIFTVAPSCTCSAENDGYNCNFDNGGNITSSKAEIRIFNNSDVASDSEFHLHCQKQGVDAKQSVQVYKSIPKVAQNINGPFILNSDTACNLNSEGPVDWVTTCVQSPTGNSTVTFQPGFFSEAPHCLATSSGGGFDEAIQLGNVLSNSLVIITKTMAGAADNQAWALRCWKKGADYKTPTVQPILVKQVETSYEKGITTESCRVDNAGTATIANASGLCDWIASVNRFSVGQVTVTFVAGIFATEPVCVATPAGNPSSIGMEYNGTGNQVQANSKDMNDIFADKPFNIKCSGRR